ncbi:GNAT family N-acetyltransferase [Parasphingorhabdus pacifica]
MDVDIAPFDLGERLQDTRALARTAMTAADQPGGILIAKYLDEVTELDGLLALGAFQQGELAGMLVGWPTASREWWPHRVGPALAATENEHWLEDAFEVAELHVHPEAQACGVGTGLIDEAVRRIDNPRMVLSTNAIENRRAREFYRRRGFRTLTGPFQWLGLPLRILVLGRELRTP